MTTTPTDAIGLNERLRKHNISDDDGSIYMIDNRTACEAATQLDALSADNEHMADTILKLNEYLADANARALRAEQERDEAYERAVKCIPTNWCDELLTGPKAPRGPLDCQAIERLLLEIIKRIRRLAAETEKEGE